MEYKLIATQHLDNGVISTTYAADAGYGVLVKSIVQSGSNINVDLTTVSDAKLSGNKIVKNPDGIRERGV